MRAIHRNLADWSRPEGFACKLTAPAQAAQRSSWTAALATSCPNGKEFRLESQALPASVPTIELVTAKVMLDRCRVRARKSQLNCTLCCKFQGKSLPTFWLGTPSAGITCAYSQENIPARWQESFSPTR